MRRRMMKSKIHRATVTDANLDTHNHAVEPAQGVEALAS